MNVKMTNPLRNRVAVFLCTGAFLILYSLIQLVTVKFRDGIFIGELNISATTMAGIFSSLMVFVCIFMTCIDHIRGSVAAYCLLGIDLLSLLIQVFVVKNTGVLPSFPMVFVGLFSVYIIRRQFSALEMTAYTDFLTGMLNRRGVVHEMERLIDKNISFYSLYIDLDGFKQINDNKGHKIGDTILCTLSERLGTVQNHKGFIGRIGGDEFLVVIRTTMEAEVKRVADECIRLLNEPVSGGDGKEYSVTATLGCSLFPKDGADTTELIKNADIATMYAKNLGKNKLVFFNDSMSADIVKQEHMEELIKRSIANDYFFLVYQPQFIGADKKLRGFETLLRMKVPEEGIISPAEFIPAAEKSDLIFDIDHYVLDRAMREFAEPIKKAGCSYMLSINISARHITSPDFVDDVKQAVERSGFPVECLEIEITEYCFVASIDDAIRNINLLKEMGVKIALDDFGTGYASLSYLSKLPIDLVKIDKSFVDNIETDETACDFISAVISIGHILGCKVISEGVESEAQLDLLIDRECDYIQGYVWGKPLEYSAALGVAGA